MKERKRLTKTQRVILIRVEALKRSGAASGARERAEYLRKIIDSRNAKALINLRGARRR